MKTTSVKTAFVDKWTVHVMRGHAVHGLTRKRLDVQFPDDVTSDEISRSLQRLRKQGLVRFKDGEWFFVPKGLKGKHAPERPPDEVGGIE